MEKKTLIAILLSVVVWVGWFWIFPPENKKPQPQNQKVVSDTEKVQNKNSQNQSQKVVNTTNKVVRIKRIGKEKTEKFYSVKTKKFNFKFSNKGASIDSLEYLDLTKDKMTKKEKIAFDRLVEKKKNKKILTSKELLKYSFYQKKLGIVELAVKRNPFNASGVLDFSIDFSEEDFLNGNALRNELWTLTESSPTKVVFSIDTIFKNASLRIEKIYTLKPDGYAFNLSYKIINRSNKSISFDRGGVFISASDLIGPEMDYSNHYNTLEGFYNVGKDFNKISKGGGFFSKKGGPIKREDGPVSWFGIMSRYFIVLMEPQGFKGTDVISDDREKKGFRTGLKVKIATLAPHQQVEKSFRIFIGEKDKAKIATVSKSFEPAADVSIWVEPIRKFVIWSLLWLNKFIGNMGWSLVIFSILTKMVFMPLTIKSTESMKKMSQLTPKINELKKKYKDKPDVLQKQTMALYKENGVNPIGGCLPMLLQMPFFFGLYSALINSIHLWNAPFLLWMTDLAMPDTVATIAGFNLNILPILMTITSFYQQKLTTADTGGQQKMLTMMMPIFLIFIFWSMPSGLVLYWTLQNVFQVGHQAFVNKRGSSSKK